MNKLTLPSILLLAIVIVSACTQKTPDAARKAILEVEGKFLYEEDIQKIIPPNISDSDSIDIAQSFIKKWTTDVLMYENAKRNISNKSEIDELVESYRKSLIIHQYQQRLIEQRLPKEPSEQDLKAFYDQYSDQLQLKESIIKGLMLIVPAKAPKLSNVRSWVQSGNTQSLENIEKYSIQNAISYDYFGDRWIQFSEILKKIPIKVEDASTYLSSHRFIEVADSTKHYFLKVEAYKNSGQVEPYEMAKDKITNILLNKQKAEFVAKFENDLYNDAVKDETVNFFKK